MNKSQWVGSDKQKHNPRLGKILLGGGGAWDGSEFSFREMEMLLFLASNSSVVFVCADNRIKNCDKTLLAFMRLMKVIAAGNNNVLVGACLLEFTGTS